MCCSDPKDGSRGQLTLLSYEHNHMLFDAKKQFEVSLFSQIFCVQYHVTFLYHLLIDFGCSLL